MLAANFSKARRKNNHPIATSGLLVILTVPGEVLHGETGGQRSPEVAQIAGDVTGSYRSYFQGFQKGQTDTTAHVISLATLSTAIVELRGPVQTLNSTPKQELRHEQFIICRWYCWLR